MESLDMSPFPLIWVWQMTKKINVSVEVPCLEGSLALLLALEERKSRDHTKGLLLTSSLRPLCHPCIPVTFYDLLTLTSSTGQGLVWPVMSFHLWNRYDKCEYSTVCLFIDLFLLFIQERRRKWWNWYIYFNIVWFVFFKRRSHLLFSKSHKTVLENYQTLHYFGAIDG